MSKTEQFECQDCLQVGALTQHGACSNCGGQAVVSLEVKEILQFLVDLWKPEAAPAV